MKTLRVTVVPKAMTSGPLSRAQNLTDYQIDIAVQKKLNKSDNSEVDPLMIIVQEIADFFRLRRLTAYPSAAWISTEDSPIYAQEHFVELRQFTSVLTLTFRVSR
jgi:hypothetical protein